MRCCDFFVSFVQTFILDNHLKSANETHNDAQKCLSLHTQRIN